MKNRTSRLQNIEKILDRMQFDLLRAGILLLLGAGMILSLIAVLFMRNDKSNIYLMIIGGLVGLILAMKKPGRPSLIGMRFDIPKELSTYELQLRNVILKLRSKQLIFIVASPYFAWLIYEAVSKKNIFINDVNILFGSAFISFIFVSFVVSASQYLQVWWSLKRGVYKDTIKQDSLLLKTSNE